MNPINDYEIDSGINRGLRDHDNDRHVRWAKTVWRKWLLRQEQFAPFIPADVGLEARIIPPLNIMTRSERFQDFLFERERKTIPIQEVYEHASSHVLDYTYEISISGNWCTMYAAWQWKLLMNAEVQWWSVDARDALRGIMDWMDARPQDLPADLSRLSAPQAQEASFDWHARMRIRESSKSSDPGQRKELKDGVWCLLDEQSLWHEGKTMHHCIGSYWPQVKSGAIRVYHTDYPSATVEVIGLRITQSRGVCNADVTLPYNIKEIILQHALVENEKSRKPTEVA